LFELIGINFFIFP